MSEPIFLTLDEWGGTANGWPEMALPVPNLDVHHSVTNEDVGVLPTEDATADFRELDALGLARGHGGISYSYAIHPSGVIGEGQGTRRGAHTAGDGCNGSRWGWNPCTLGVVFIGDFEPRENVIADALTPESINSFRWLRDKLIITGLLVPGIYPTGGHRDMAGNATACPGQNIEDRLDVLRQLYVPSNQEFDMLIIRTSDGKREAVIGSQVFYFRSLDARPASEFLPLDPDEWDYLHDALTSAGAPAVAASGVFTITGQGQIG